MPKFIPNSFQTPNFYIDYLDQYLLPSETKVLFKAIREILGWHTNIEERVNDLSLNDFIIGTYKENGEVRSFGCGLCRDSVIKALAALCQYNILQRRERTKNGTRFFLNLDAETFDWAGLQARKNSQDERKIAQTRNARSKKHARTQGDHSTLTKVVAKVC